MLRQTAQMDIHTPTCPDFQFLSQSMNKLNQNPLFFIPSIGYICSNIKEYPRHNLNHDTLTVKKNYFSYP